MADESEEFSGQENAVSGLRGRLQRLRGGARGRRSATRPLAPDADNPNEPPKIDHWNLEYGRRYGDWVFHYAPEFSQDRADEDFDFEVITDKQIARLPIALMGLGRWSVRPTKVQLAGGLESSLFTGQVARRVLIFTFDVDPLFGERSIKLLRLVPRENVSSALREVIDRLYVEEGLPVEGFDDHQAVADD